MTSWQRVRLFAGSFILLSLALGIPGSPLFVSQWWLAFTAFVGVNLLQSALTKWCFLETMLRKLGARPGLSAWPGRCACVPCACTGGGVGLPRPGWPWRRRTRTRPT